MMLLVMMGASKSLRSPIEFEIEEKILNISTTRAKLCLLISLRAIKLVYSIVSILYAYM